MHRKAITGILQRLSRYFPFLIFTLLLAVNPNLATAQLGHYKVEYSSDNTIVLRNGTPIQMHLEIPNTLGEHYRGSGLASAGHTGGYPPQNTPAHASMEGNITVKLT